MDGKLIIIEGLDGSGKATQTKLLFEALQAEGHNIKAVSFPNYGSPACGPVEMYLGGEFGSEPGDVNAWAASTFYAVDRYASYKTAWEEFYTAGGLVVSDRYTVSNAVHQCCKLPKEQWDDYLDWLFEFEYKRMGIPEPALVVYLDMKPAVSQRLMNERYKDGGKKDIHEKDIAYLENARKAAMYCIEKYGWTRIECDDGENVLPLEEIAARVLSAAKSCL